MRRAETPQPPRIDPPDLPDELDGLRGIGMRAEALQSRITGLDEVTDATYSALTECVLDAAGVQTLNLARATLVDIEIVGLRVTSVSGRDGRWRRVRVNGGRIGTLDLTAAELDEVELRDVRVDYLSAAGARLVDVVVANTTIGTLDLPQATVSRMAFASCRADEVDTRGLRAEHLDLRGLEAASYLDPTGLRGATLTGWQVEQLAPALAAALGIDVRE